MKMFASIFQELEMQRRQRINSCISIEKSFLVSWVDSLFRNYWKNNGETNAAREHFLTVLDTNVMGR